MTEYPLTEVQVEGVGLRHAITHGDLFTVHETDGHVLWLEAARERVEELLDAEYNPEVEVLGEHRGGA